MFFRTYESFNLKNFTIEHPALEAGKYHVLFKFRFPKATDNTPFIFRMKSSVDNNMLKYFRLRLCEIPKEGEEYMLQTIEGVHKNIFEYPLVH